MSRVFAPLTYQYAIYWPASVPSHQVGMQVLRSLGLDFELRSYRNSDGTPVYVFIIKVNQESDADILIVASELAASAKSKEIRVERNNITTWTVPCAD